MFVPRRRTGLGVVALVLSVLFLPSCASKQNRRLFRPDEFSGSVPRLARSTASRTQPDYLKVHLKDGRLLRLTEWNVDEKTARVEGRGEVLDLNRHPVRTGVVGVPIDSVALFETNETQISPAVALLSVVTAASLGLTAVCATNPKACFGSCPTFYASDGERDRVQAEGFSASVAPILEATDLDGLYRVRCSADSLTLRVTNVALETHVIRRADLLVAARPPGGRVFATRERGFFAATEPVAPDLVAAAGENCLDLLQRFDGRERFSLADSTRLDAKEELVLEYHAMGGDSLGLVVAFRQSLLTTFLFYQTLAYLGSSVGEWLARLERSDPTLATRIGEPGRVLGGIAVSVQRTGGWVTAGEIHETGPLATDVRLLPLPPIEGDTVRVRLRLTKGAWRLDWVGLTHLLGPVQPIRLSPVRVLRDGVESPEARSYLCEQRHPLVTLPGDAYTLVYQLPPSETDREFFLESRGYYLEWMRPQWIEEENPRLAARMFLDPAQSLRDLAPQYKRVEAGMEQSFWSSRYARP